MANRIIKEVVYTGKLIDLTGQRFGKLTVLERAEDHVSPNGRRYPMWRCICDCGNETVVNGQSLRRGETKSCGCSRFIRTIHRGHGSRLYKVWENMLTRCYNRNSPSYKNYGARGITVCDEWRYDFSAFRDWAISTGYDDTAPYGECTIERLDVFDGYCPENCAWKSMKEQSLNKRNTIRLDYDGEARTLIELCEELGVDYGNVYARLRRGWTPEEALTGTRS